MAFVDFAGIVFKMFVASMRLIEALVGGRSEKCDIRR